MWKSLEALPTASVVFIADMKTWRGQNPRDDLLFTIGINVHLRISDLLSFRIGDVWINGGGQLITILIERKNENAILPKITLIQNYAKTQGPTQKNFCSGVKSPTQV